MVCDGLKGLPEAIATVWPQTITQTCISPPSAELVPLRLEEGLVRDREGPQARLHRGVRIRRAGPVRGVQREVGEALPGDHRLWTNAWAEFVPFLQFGACCRMACPSHGSGEGPFGRGVRAGSMGPAATASGGCRVDLPHVVGGGRAVQLAAGCADRSRLCRPPLPSVRRGQDATGRPRHP